MTVDELIEKLQEKSDKGYGNAPVSISLDCHDRIRSACGFRMGVRESYISDVGNIIDVFGTEGG